MAKPDPDKSLLPEPDPEKIAWHKLFLFWESYEKEFTDLLADWHRDTVKRRTPDPDPTVPPRSTGNVLYDSFLDTWGKGKFEDPNVSLDRKSYFAALADVSIGVRNECLKVLRGILKADENGNITPDLKVDVETANRKAQEELDRQFEIFNNVHQTLKTKIDPCVENAIQGSNDPYLKALLRMMLIETRCFEVQKNFLETGKVLPGGP